MPPMTAGETCRQKLPLAAATIALALAAACTDGDEGGDEASGTTGPRPEWCRVLETLDLPADAPDVDLDDVPEELQVWIQFIAENEAELEAMREAGEDLSDVETAGAVETRTWVEAWGEEHCGTPDPFCSLWVSFNELVAADPTVVPVQHAVRTLDDELIEYAPDELVHAVKDHLVEPWASLGTPAPNDYEEDDGETAYTELNEWVRSHC